MKGRRHMSLYFDQQDREILSLVNRILDAPSAAFVEGLIEPELHPHGIQEMVTSQASRMAAATVNLLRNLEGGGSSARGRLCALQTLFDEVMASAHSWLRRNTARVLLQIMKEMVRAHGDTQEQLRLARAFRQTALGRPRVVRRMLALYHLAEMPEDWNQVAFDNHVYDVNTKGRKTPTHLIMDAWIKGMGCLTVLYDNCIEMEAAGELLEAAAITGMKVRVGIEYRVPFYGRYVSLLWVPRGFSSSRDFMAFMDSPAMQAMQQRGRGVLHWLREHAMQVLECWNDRQRPELEARWKVSIPPASVEDFLDFLGRHHSFMLRLAEYLHQLVLPALRQRAQQLAPLAEGGDAAARAEIDELEHLTSDVILHSWLSVDKFPELPDVQVPSLEESVPELRRISMGELVRQLRALTPGYRLTLCTDGLDAADVIELIWDCQGGITHLELFNTKSWMAGELTHIREISELQQILNHGMGPHMKQMVRQIIRRLEAEHNEERLPKFQEILRDIPQLWETYRHTPLKTRLGSNAATRLRSFGMGLAIRETLPRRGVAALSGKNASTPPIPIYSPVEEHFSYTEPEHPTPCQQALSRLRFLPGGNHLGMERHRCWVAASEGCRYAPDGNILALGGHSIPAPNALLPPAETRHSRPGLGQLNSAVCDTLKVLAGFFPAFFTFLYTQEWWVLAWFGAFIWFGITGVRNVLQMVMAAQGFTRGSLTHWKEHVSVTRLCDSLMFTGISVLLLEGILRVLILQDIFGITIADSPIIVFSVLNIINGFYIFSHNVFRGFPRTASIGNLFRSILAIPVSSLGNTCLFYLLLFCGIADPLVYLTPSAAIVSKLASDAVAALIEGFADSQANLRMRRRDYWQKLRRVFDCATRLELLFPREDALNKLARPGGLGGRGGPEAARLERALIISALDLQYFWFYQPRAQEAFRQVLRSMSPADLRVFFRSQLVLLREKEISQLMVNGLLGHNFSKPLVFFLNNNGSYLRAMTRLCRIAEGRSAHAAAEGRTGQTA